MLNTRIIWDGNSVGNISGRISEWELAGLSLDELLQSKESWDEVKEKAVEEELFRRYRPCVRGKENEIEMNPHYRTSTLWKIDTNQWSRYRNCVTYEDPNSPDPEQSLDTDRFWTRFEETEMNKATEIANEEAKPRTAIWWEVYLSTLTQNNVTVNRIMTGIKPDGYAWNRIGFTERENPLTEGTKTEVDIILD